MADVDADQQVTEVNNNGLAKRYILSKVIGEGATGLVYRAWDSVLGKIVALKVLHIWQRELSPDLFAREVLIAQGLTHPNIVRIHDIVHEPHVTCISMELVDGPTLAHLLQKQHTLSTKDISRLAADIASALSYAHERHVVHCDLKPSNIFVENDRVLIGDFGLAVTLTAKKRQSEYCGTPEYMSPEQQQQLPVDQRTDFYSFGLVLFEAAAGRRATVEELAEVQSTALKRAVKGIPAHLRKVILRCLRRNPADRYATAGEILRELGVKPQVPAAHWSLLRRQVHRLTSWLVVGGSVVVASLALFSYADKSISSSARPITLRVLLLPVASGQQSLDDDALLVFDSLGARLSAHPNVTVYKLPIGINKKIPSLIRSHTDWIIGVSLTRTKETRLARAEIFTEHGHSVRRAVFASGTVDEIATSLDRQVSTMLKTSPSGPHSYPSLPKSAAAYQEFAHAFHSVKSLTKTDDDLRVALADLSGILDKEPACAACLLLRAQAESVLSKRTNNSEYRGMAINDAKKALVYNRSSYTALQVAKICLDLDEFEYAGTVLQQRSLGLLDTATGKCLMGRLAANEELYPYAIDNLEEAIKRNPLDLTALNWLGATELQDALYSDAIAVFLQMLEIDPENRAGLNNLATAYLRVGNSEAAIPLLERVVRQSPVAASYSNLGLALSYQGKGVVALPYFEMAKSLQPDSFFTGALAHAYRWAGMRDEARREYKEAIRLAKAELRVQPTAETFANAALYYAALGDRQHFDMNIARAAAATRTMSPIDLEYKRAIGLVLLGDDEEGSEILRRLTKDGFPRAFEIQNPDLRALRSIIEKQS